MAGLQRLRGRLTVGPDAWQDDSTNIFRKAHRRPVGYDRLEVRFDRAEP